MPWPVPRLDTRRGKPRASRALSSGQSLAEVAIALPVLLLIGLGITDVGRAFYFRESVTNAARQGLRVAVSPGQQLVANNACAGSAGTATATLPPPSGSPIATLANDVSLESTSDGTPAGSVISGATLTVSWHCAAGKAITNSTNGGVTDPANPASDAATVTVTYQLPLIVSNLFGPAQVTLRSTVTGRMEY